MKTFFALCIVLFFLPGCGTIPQYDSSQLSGRKVAAFPVAPKRIPQTILSPTIKPIPDSLLHRYNRIRAITEDSGKL